MNIFLNFINLILRVKGRKERKNYFFSKLHFISYVSLYNFFNNSIQIRPSLMYQIACQNSQIGFVCWLKSLQKVDLPLASTKSSSANNPQKPKLLASFVLELIERRARGSFTTLSFFIWFQFQFSFFLIKKIENCIHF